MREVDFYAKSEQFVRWFLGKNPVTATYMGIHTWDDRLADFHLESLDEIYRKLIKMLAELEEVNFQQFSREGQVDFLLFQQILKAIKLEHQVVAPHLRNPNLYLEEVYAGMMGLIFKEFAPLAERMRSLWGRLEAVPGVMLIARNNIIPEQVPPVWVEVALEQGKMAPLLFQQLIPQLVDVSSGDKQDIIDAAERAAQAMREYITYLEQDVLPVAEGNFAVGEDYFNQLLKERHMVDYDAHQLLEIGWQLFEETESQMNLMAQEINFDKSAREILAEAKTIHPAADKLLDSYRQAMEETRQFVIDHDIATIPAREKLTIVETPPYLRPLIPFAAYMQPGIFEDDLEGLFMVTPVNPNASQEEQKEKLKGHFSAEIPVTSLHEGYPGHHLQLVWSVTHGSLIRKLGTMIATMFIEGWAFYCEELMEEMRYIDEPIQKLARLADQLWRAGRIIIDVSLHCQDMSEEEAVEFLIERCQLEPSNALAEVRRYTFSPTQPQSYLMGKLEIISIIEEYEESNPESSLKEIHDTILACGSLPPALMRKQLFG